MDKKKVTKEEKAA